MNAQPSQKLNVLSALQAGRGLTPLDALTEFGLFRLGAAIYDLRKEGHLIITEDFKTPTGKRVARYWLTQGEAA